MLGFPDSANRVCARHLPVLLGSWLILMQPLRTHLLLVDYEQIHVHGPLLVQRRVVEYVTWTR